MLDERIIKSLKEMNLGDGSLRIRVRTNWLVSAGFSLFYYLFCLAMFGHNIYDIMYSLLIGLGLLYILALSSHEPSPRPVQIHLDYLLHLILPNRSKRFEQSITISLDESQLDETSFMSMDRFKELTKYNIKAWVDKYIGRETSVHNLVNARVLGYNVLQMDLIYWSQIIPIKRKGLSSDVKRIMLMSCQLLDDFKTQHSLTMIKPEIGSLVETLFIDYSESDLQLLFSSPYAVGDYLEILIRGQDFGKPLELKRSMRELLLWLKSLKYLKTYNSNKEWIRRLDGFESELGTFVFVKNSMEVERWGHYLNNCLRNYGLNEAMMELGTVNLFGVYRDDKPYMCVKLTASGAFMEAKRKANKPLTVEELRVVLGVLNSIR